MLSPRPIQKSLIVLILSIFVTACGDKNSIAMIGLSEDGTAFEEIIPNENFKEMAIKAIRPVNDNVLIALNKKSENNHWELNRLDVGLGLSAEVGFGPFGVGAEPSFILRFEK